MYQANTRRLVQGRTGPELNTLETEGQMLRRVMPELMSKGNVLVFNDEGHHCYRQRTDGEPVERELDAEEKPEAEKNNESARVWISGVEAVKRKIGVTGVIDLSATPFFLRGSGYAEGTLFPWTVCDFSLMDAIESGIVKIPRVPIDDNVHSENRPVFRDLWRHISGTMPRAGRRRANAVQDPRSLPPHLQSALDALYDNYGRTFNDWQEASIEEPPVFIAVCNNTATSKLVYEYISGFERPGEDGKSEPQFLGKFKLFSNYDENGIRRAIPRTLLIDSEQMSATDALPPGFRAAAAPAIERFRWERVQRTGDRNAADSISDEDLLREMMNTVGKKDRLGADVRCVVSVSMLTEGWDANTVTHIIGVRAFGTQLLCEQVVGRALRRQSYELNEDSLFDVEYADVLGIPFDFTASDKPAPPPQPPAPTVRVHAVSPERDRLEIQFPNITAYRVELPDEKLSARFGEDSVPETDHGANRPNPDAEPGHHRPRNKPDGGEAEGDTAQANRVRADCPRAATPPAGNGRIGKDPPVRPTPSHRQTMARPVSAVRPGHLPGAGAVPRNRRPGRTAHQGGHCQCHPGRAGRRGTAHQGPSPLPIPQWGQRST